MASALTDVKIRAAKPRERPYKLQDGQGLYLEVRPSGVKIWRYRYWLSPRKDGIYTIGEYPGISLQAARREREQVREQVRQGLNPTLARKISRIDTVGEQQNTFALLAAEWVAQHREAWSASYLRQVERSLAVDILPRIGAFPMRAIRPAHVLDLLREVEGRGAKSIAILIRQWVGAVFRYAIATLRAESDPTLALRGAIRRPRVRHHPPLSAADLPRFLAGLAAYAGYGLVKPATMLMLLTFVRTAEIRSAAWADIDLEAAIWRIPAAKMKMGTEHIVPLSRQAVALLRGVCLHSHRRPVVFPNSRRPDEGISNTSINRLIETIGFGGVVSGHGFRATAATLLRELGFADHLVELQLAHTDRNKVRASYNHAKYLDERRAMMQAWADYLDSIGAGWLAASQSRP